MTRRETILPAAIALSLALVVGMVAYVVTLRLEQVERQVGRSRVEGFERVIEIDCRTRRALADLPSLPPTVRCTESTPPDVYPGAP